MKKAIIPVALVMLLSGNFICAQQSPNKNQTSPARVATPNHGLIKGKPEDIVFGDVAVMETPHAMEGNRKLEFQGQTYYYNDGDYFIYNGGRYLLVAPPVSLVVNSLPEEKQQIGPDLFFCKGIFYRKTGADYNVIKEPRGAIVYNLPHDLDAVKVGDKAYYNYLGVLYEKVLVEGEQAFEVVGILTE